MQRANSYRIARYTSWIALLINIILVIYTIIRYPTDAGWYLALSAPFLIIPWIIFLIALWISDKWRNIEKITLTTFLIANILFICFAVYLIFGNNSTNNSMELIMIVISGIITAETLNILFSKK